MKLNLFNRSKTPKYLREDNLDGCSMLMMLVIAVTLLAFICTSVAIWSAFLPLWGAVLVGVPLGIAIFGLSMIGETTLMEMAVRCFICLILLAILIPIFQKARQDAQRATFQKQHLQQQTQ